MKAFSFCLIFLCQIHLAYSQDCTPDPTILEGEEVFLPEFWSPENQVFNFASACINQPYAQTLTVHIPAILFIPGFGDVAVNNFSIATTGGIVGLPSGMTYSCNPPNCVFETETLSCIQLHGTPDNINEAPDTVTLSMLGILDIGLPIVVTIPETLEPGSLWPIIMQPEEDCINAVKDDEITQSALEVFPNPFHSETTLHLLSPAAGHYSLNVFEVNGRLVHREKIFLSDGQNQIPFSSKDLVEGVYLLQLSNGFHTKSVRITILPD